MSKATQPCRACGGDPQVLGAVGLWCSECGEASGDGPPNIDGVLDPAEVEAARVRIGLSQRKAGQILGGGPRAFQKYEAGTQAVSVPMSRLGVVLIVTSEATASWAAWASYRRR
jgi:hypothetical protein